jgi:hypothetical protein
MSYFNDGAKKKEKLKGRLLVVIRRINAIGKTELLQMAEFSFTVKIMLILK